MNQSQTFDKSNIDMTPRSCDDSSMTNDAITILARQLLDMTPTDECDHITMIESLQPLLAPAIFDAICDATEICPMHLCDMQICADDDDPDCAHLQFRLDIAAPI